MNKLILLTLVSLSLAACGQKGPLIVDQPVDANGQVIDADGQVINNKASADGTNNNDTATRINRQVDGQPSIIYR